MVAVLANPEAARDSQRDVLIELRRMAKQADLHLAAIGIVQGGTIGVGNRFHQEGKA